MPISACTRMCRAKMSVFGSRFEARGGQWKWLEPWKTLRVSKLRRTSAKAFARGCGDLMAGHWLSTATQLCRSRDPWGFGGEKRRREQANCCRHELSNSMNSLADGECPFLCPSSSFCTCFHMFSRSKDLDPLLDTLVLRKGKGIHKADLIQARGEALEAVYQLKRVIGEAIPSFKFTSFEVVAPLAASTTPMRGSPGRRWCARRGKLLESCLRAPGR